MFYTGFILNLTSTKPVHTLTYEYVLYYVLCLVLFITSKAIDEDYYSLTFILCTMY